MAVKDRLSATPDGNGTDAEPFYVRVGLRVAAVSKLFRCRTAEPTLAKPRHNRPVAVECAPDGEQSQATDLPGC